MRFSRGSYSKREIVQAGKLLRETLPEASDEVLQAFRVAHDWRAAHAYPMHRIRHELRGKIRRDGGAGLTAGRVKRMASIRRKLSTSPVSLYQMQDLAGIRAILPNTLAVQRVREMFDPDQTNHIIQRENDYILSPRDSGYRSLHLVLKFKDSSGDPAFDRQTVELQLRTQRQHAWATAVEAIGLVRNEHLKGGEGSLSWQRFFALMAGEIASYEGCALPRDVPADQDVRRAEIREIDTVINAVYELDGLNEGIAAAEHVRTSSDYFLLRFDRATRTVSVVPYVSSSVGAQAYNAVDGFGASGTDVLIEVDKVSDLKAAYPNYFLDVRQFLSFARAAVEDRQVEDHQHDTASDEPSEAEGEFSWLREYERMRFVRRP